ncbi:MAG: PKD domain-containing protein, partial [Ilumatobacter sp.]
ATFKSTTRGPPGLTPSPPHRPAYPFDGAASSDADGTVDAFLWDFGDGTTSTAMTVEHTYAADGSYDVSLTVTDDDAATGTVTQTVTVERGNDDPVAEAVISCDRLECTYDASGSTDTDGTVDVYAWTFGDGGTSDQAVGVYTYAAGGEYTISLTVTDDDGATNTVTQLINPMANNDPVAAVGLPACTLLECDFSGADSSDPDGDVLSYAWDFGDGTGGVGETVTHAFAAAGTYQVTLTVTDPFAASASVVREVTVSDDPVSPLEAPQAAGVESLSVWTPTPAVSVPAEVQAGDLMILFVSSNQNPDPSDPVGVGDWVRQDRVVNGALSVAVYTRVADGTEAGQTVTVTLPSRYRSVLTLAAYRGVAPDGIEAFATFADQGASSHTTPVVSSAGEARREVSFWTDRSSSTTTWTPPADVSVLASEVGTENGRVTTLFADRVVDAGEHGGLTASTNAASSRSVAITMLLTPAGPTPNQGPTAAIGDPSCTLLECVFSGSDSSDPDGDDLTYAWDFGDGDGDVGESVTHVFAAPGTYPVSLTVTDPFDLTSTVVRQVTVSDDPVVPLDPPQLVGVEEESMWTPTPTVTVPASVQAGDLMVLFVSSNQNPDPSAPTGAGDWVREDRVVNGSLSVTVYTRVADGSEAGQTVTVTLPSRYRSVLTLAAYRGVAADGVEAFAAVEDVNLATHTTAVVSSAGEARRELSFWTDRSSTTTTWTAPAEISVASSVIGTENGRVTTLFGDRVVDAGEQGGLTASTDVASARSVAITILLTPEPAV